MPEGDTVYRTARNLDRALAGDPITRWDLRVPAHATSDLTGHDVDAVISVGKHLLLRAGDLTLHTHLLMEGEWRISRHPEGGRPSPSKADWRIRAVVGTSRATAIGYDLGTVDLVDRADEHRLIGHLGPDPLGPAWSADQAVSNLQEEPDRPVAIALLDQRVLAGLGNEYVAELCFLRGIRPDRPVGQTDAAALVRLAHRLITANRDRVQRTTTGDTRRGRQSWVHRRDGLPCRRCGTPIERSLLGPSPTAERQTFWCPSCQT